MATEGSTIDQATEKKVKEMKMDDDMKQVNERTYVEEKLKVEGATSVEASADESNALIEVVKKEESKEDSVGEATEKELESEAAEISEDNSERPLMQISKDEAEREPAVAEAVTEEMKFKDDLPSASESMGEATEKETESEAAEQLEDNLEAPLMQESEVETEKEPAVDEEVTKEMRAKSDLPSASESTGEATEKEPVSQIAEKSKVDLEAPVMQESEFEAEKEAPVAEEATEELKDKENLPSASESTGEATENESESEAAENIEAPVMQESEVEAEKEPSVAETVTEENKDKYGAPSASETKDKEAQSAAVTTVKEHASDISATPDASRSAKVIINDSFLAEVEDNYVPSKEEPSSDDIPFQVAAATNETKDAGASLPEVPGTREKTDYNPNTNDGIEELVQGETEVLKKSTEVEEKEGKATEGEDPPLSEVFKGETVIQVVELLSQGGDVEKIEKSKVDSLGADRATWVETSKDFGAPFSEVSCEGVKATGVSDLVEALEGGKSLEDDKTTSAETTRDLDVDSTVNDDSKAANSESKVSEATEAIIDKSVNEELEDKKDVNEKAAEAKDDGCTMIDGEAPKQEVPIKSSQRQSNNILSKVKQSIVKVKKAIIGKSPSSKTMSSEGKDDIKIK